MVFRVQREHVDATVVLVISGDIVAGEASALQAVVDAEAGRRVVLDLGEASVVDRAGVLFLANNEAAGATLTNCPAYVRGWIERERSAPEGTRPACPAARGTDDDPEGWEDGD